MFRLSIQSVFLITILFFAQNLYAKEKLNVFVSVAPQKYFVEKIGGELVDVKVMVLPGASPATYEPKPRQMAGIAKTRIYFSIGVPFEKVWLDKIVKSNPDMTLVRTDADIDKIPMVQQRHIDTPGDGDHGKRIIENDHDHGAHDAPDPHIWTSPPLVIEQARVILSALQEEDPLNSEIFNYNFNKFLTEVKTLDAQLREIFKGKQGLGFMVFHPSWGYFAHTYGLQQIPVEVEGKHPKPAQLMALIEHARANGIRVIFVQPQFSAKSAAQVAREIDGEVVFADPLALNWSDNLKEVATRFKAALR